MRMRIDRSIVYPWTSDTGIQRTALDSLLGLGRPARGRAVSTTENSCRASQLLVYRITCLDQSRSLRGR